MITSMIVKIKGMHCTNCESLIEKEIGILRGVKKVKADYKASLINIEFDSEQISREEIERIIEELDYEVVSSDKKAEKKNWLDIVSILIIILCVYVIANRLGLTKLFYYFPTARQGAGYAMLFVVGLFTSVHCISMCGGISMTQSVRAAAKGASVIRANTMYNIGRVISYTVLGGAVGYVGSVFSMNGRQKGAVALIAGAFMLIMGLNMLNVFPPLKRLNITMPRRIQHFFRKRKNGNSSFYIGLINGFMPCGPLQSMQLFALSSGSFLNGALAMFVFSVGTVPLMFGFGALAGKLNKRVSSVVFQISAILVILLGAGMLRNGLALSGVILPGEVQTSGRKLAMVEDGYQVVQTELDYGSYEAIEVKKGIPVRLIIYAEREKINGCNNEIIIPEYNITKGLSVGENVIEFTPTKEGMISYSCWMGMIRSSILVKE